MNKILVTLATLAMSAVSLSPERVGPGRSRPLLERLAMDGLRGGTGLGGLEPGGAILDMGVGIGVTTGSIRGNS